MQQYKIDIFNLNMELLYFSPLLEAVIAVDYQQLPESEFTLLFKIPDDIKLRYFVRVSEFYTNKILFEGYISSITEEENKTKLYCNSLYSLLNYQIWYDRVNFNRFDLETNLETLLEMQYGTRDKFKNISYKVKKHSSTITQMFNLKDNIFNIFEDVAIKALNMYDFIVRIYLESLEKKVVFEFANLPTNENILETSNTDIIEIETNENDTKDAPNIITLVDKNSNEERVQFHYYLSKDGSISPTMPSFNRVYPPVHEYEYFEYTGDDYFGDILNYTSSIARDKLIPKKYNHLIEITILNASKLIDISNLQIGDKFKIYDKQATIESILTGYEIEESHSIKLIFGNLRIKLTDILKERLK